MASTVTVTPSDSRHWARNSARDCLKALSLFTAMVTRSGLLPRRRTPSAPSAYPAWVSSSPAACASYSSAEAASWSYAPWRGETGRQARSPWPAMREAVMDARSKALEKAWRTRAEAQTPPLVRNPTYSRVVVGKSQAS